MEVLTKERDKTNANNRRLKVLLEWQQKPAAEIVPVLESGQLPEYAGGWNDYDILLNAVFQIHADELGGDLLTRLWRLAERTSPTATETAGNRDAMGFFSPTPAQRFRLQLHLIGRTRDSEKLGQLWRKHFDDSDESGGGVLASRQGFIKDDWLCLQDFESAMDTAGRIRTADPLIPRNLINFLQSGGFFSPRWAAVHALGRIGPAVGGLRAEAAAAIRREVHDSTPEIVRARDLVLRRLESTDQDWVPCTHCRDGYVITQSSSLLHEQHCPECRGLGLVPSTEVHCTHESHPGCSPSH